MISRFTDFLETDGEKPNRDRDSEFEDENLNHDQLIAKWNQGWDCVLQAVSNLKASDLDRTVYIRGEAHTVLRALQRQVVHYAYHCGQIVFLCKMIRSMDFQSLSIPRGKSKEFNLRSPGEMKGK